MARRGLWFKSLSPQPDIAKGSRLRRQHRDCFQVHLLSAGYSCTFSNWEELLWHALCPRPPVVDSMLSFSPQGIQTMLLYIPDKSTNEVNNNKNEWKKNQAKGASVEIIITSVISSMEHVLAVTVVQQQLPNLLFGYKDELWFGQRGSS